MLISYRKHPPLRKIAELQFYLIHIFLHVCYLVFSFFGFAINILSKAYEAMLAAVTLVVHNHSIIVLLNEITGCKENEVKATSLAVCKRCELITRMLFILLIIHAYLECKAEYNLLLKIARAWRVWPYLL